MNISGARIEQFDSAFNKDFNGLFYISLEPCDMVLMEGSEQDYWGTVYLHNDGIWRPTTNNGKEFTGFFKIKEQAQKVLEECKKDNFEILNYCELYKCSFAEQKRQLKLFFEGLLNLSDTSESQDFYRELAQKM